ncbi:MAG: hypothetical protein H3C34_09760, partial [Caldilineaceae bacterium]|nr:hypothetical protein [Caldilineaceae bacterium]
MLANSSQPVEPSRPGTIGGRKRDTLHAQLAVDKNGLALPADQLTEDVPELDSRELAAPADIGGANHLNGVVGTATETTSTESRDSAGTVVWGLLEKARPLPTADGSDYIEIEPSAEERRAITLLWQTLPDGLRPESRELILRAYKLASYAHRNIQRDSGEPYITHP